jgi:K+-transporting ATPase ATPase C chain
MENSKPNYRPVVGLALVSLILCGLFFPLLITGIAQIVFPNQANGDLAKLDGRIVGSYLIDNSFTLPVFFHTRNESDVLNASASLVDPDITLDQAYSQIPRINEATGIPSSDLRSIVNGNVEGTFWIFGSPYVNVLKLNLILINEYQAVYKNFTA